MIEMLDMKVVKGGRNSCHRVLGRVEQRDQVLKQVKTAPERKNALPEDGGAKKLLEGRMGKNLAETNKSETA